MRSSAERSLQHDPISWQVGPAGFVEADGPDPECLVVARSFSAWLARLDPEDRRLLTDELFDALSAGGATTFEDLCATPAAIQKVIASLREVDPRTRDMMRSLLGELVGAGVAAAGEAITDAAAGAATRAARRVAGLVGAPRDQEGAEN